jgi:putative hemolysin
MWVEIALVAALILINAALSGSEIALVTLRDSQIHRLAAESERGKRLAALTADPNRFLSTIQIGITIAGTLASATAAVSLASSLASPLRGLGDAAEPAAVFIVTLVLSYLTLVFGELAPKRMAMQRSQEWALRAAGPITFGSKLARPLVWLLARSTEAVVRLVGLDPHAAREEVSEEEIKDIIASQESIPEQQRSIIEGALELDERRLWQVLVPRTDVVFVTANQDAATARDHLIEAGLSRAPVIGSTEDDVIGFVHLRQLVAGVGIVADYVRPALVLPDSVGVLQALGRMQQQRGQLALVVDEFGSVAGIVTLEDLLEEIVGEIYDEFDLDHAHVVRRPDGDIELAGSFPAHDLADLGIDLEAGRHATIAGIMLEEIGEFPPVGRAVRVGDWRLTALEVTPRAVLRVQLTPLTPEAAQEADLTLPEETATADTTESDRDGDDHPADDAEAISAKLETPASAGPSPAEPPATEPLSDGQDLMAPLLTTETTRPVIPAEPLSAKEAAEPVLTVDEAALGAERAAGDANGTSPGGAATVDS